MRPLPYRARAVALAVGATSLVVGAAALVSCHAPSDTPAVAAHSRSARSGPTIRLSFSTPVPGWPSGLAADGDGIVVLSGGRVVTALAASDGAEQWQATVGGELTPFTEPALDEQTVLVSAGDRFVALDRMSGASRWEAATAGDARGVALARASDGRGVAITATASGDLVARDPRDGEPRWSITGPGMLDAHLAIADGAGAVADGAGAVADGAGANGAGGVADGARGGGVVAAIWRTPAAATLRVVDATTGATRWEVPAGPFVASPTIAGDVVVVADGDGNYHARVRAFAVADGAPRWSASVPASFEPDLVPAVDAAARDLVVVDHLGTVTLLDLRTGALRWRATSDVPTLGGRPVLTAGAVVVRNEGQEVVVVDRRRGRVVARRRDPAGLPEAIAGSGRRVLVAWRRTEPGRVDALELR